MVLSIAIQKGGTGKTSTAAALVNAAAYNGQRVLAIDLDPQGQFSYTLSADTTAPGSFEMITGEPYIIQTVDGVDVICASWNLSTITSSKGSARRLQRALQPLKSKYDLIITDTPPTVGELQYNALQASEKLIIPLQATIYDLQSLYQITDTARQIQQTNENLTIAGFVLTQYDGRSTIAKAMRDNIIAAADDLRVPYLGEIRRAVAVQEAAALQMSLFKYAPKSKPAQDYMALYKQVIQEV